MAFVLCLDVALGPSCFLQGGPPVCGLNVELYWACTSVFKRQFRLDGFLGPLPTSILSLFVQYQFEEHIWAARRWLGILNATHAFFKFDELSTVVCYP